MRFLDAVEHFHPRMLPPYTCDSHTCRMGLHLPVLPVFSGLSMLFYEKKGDLDTDLECGYVSFFGSYRKGPILCLSSVSLL